MGDGRELVAAVPIRCCAPQENLARPTCGDPARWLRPGAGLTIVGYFCDVHRESTDVAIADAAVVRRISIFAEVVFNATIARSPAGEHEALARLREAVDAVGGVVSLHSVCASVGRQPMPAFRQAAISPPGGGDVDG